MHLNSSSSWESKFRFSPLSKVLQKNNDLIELDPLLKYKEITVRLWGRGVVLRGEKSGSEIGGKMRFRVRRNQFILSRIDARNGAFGLVPPELDCAVVSNDFPTFNVVGSLLLPEYLGWLCRTRPFVARCAQASEGTTNRVRLKENEFYQIEIPLPPLPEQRRIVARIEQFVAKMDEINRLEQLVDTSILSFTLSQHRELSGPRNFKIGELIELSEDRQEIKAENDYPQIGIRGFGGGLFQKGALRGSDTTYKYFNRLQAGQIVLSQVKGWEGAIAVCPSEMERYYASPEYRTFSCKHGVCDPAYMNFLVRTPWFHGILAGATRGQGARRERTRPELFLSLTIPMPEFRQQQRAVGILKQLHQIPVLHVQTAAKLDALLPSVLDKAFRGEL